ncbi:UNKNOWN [Stylonychia lemnae]|uniref:Uncharacterized protein n=1 Tax=Stylonychia lemnae TaxID=5949 RepID=A0A078B9R8_STYLE|nr:UNKNOWN [Stylonychia lemnae]|eukprot:CDW91270.1 UNKNOWN [Stylonychia lemnae]
MRQIPPQRNETLLKSQQTLAINVLTGNVLRHSQYNKDLKELEDTINENREEIINAFAQFSFHKDENSPELIKVHDLSQLFTKLEEITILDLSGVKDYIYQKFSLRLERYSITCDDLFTAIQLYIEYAQFKRAYPDYEKDKEPVFFDNHIASGRPIGYLTAYTIKSDDPREPLRVRNLQLLCFKLATHRQNILKLLDKYQGRGQDSGLLDPKKGNLIPFSKLRDLMQELSKLLGIVIASYDQFKQSIVPTENSKTVCDKFEQFIYLQMLQISQKNLERKVSLIKKQTTVVNGQKKKVKFLEDGLQAAKQDGQGFKPDFFMFNIDKFFSKELNCVIQPTDDEYQNYLLDQEREKKELDQAINELDDFFFQLTEPDVNQNLDKRDQEADQMIQQQDSDHDFLSQQLQKNIKDYENILKMKQYKSDKERIEIIKLVDTLKQQLGNYRQQKSQRPISNRKVEEAKPKEDIHEQRLRGMKEIFHFYSRQHIPHNRQFDDLKEIMNEVDLGEYTKFCKDFEIPLSKAKITEIFKKCSINHKPHKFEQFYNSMGKIGQEINKDKLEELNIKIKEIGKQIKLNHETQNYNQKRKSSEDQINESQVEEQNYDRQDESMIIDQRRNSQNSQGSQYSLRSFSQNSRNEEQSQLKKARGIQKIQDNEDDSVIVKQETIVEEDEQNFDGLIVPSKNAKNQLDSRNNDRYNPKTDSYQGTQRNSKNQIAIKQDPLEQELDKLVEQKNELENKTEEQCRDQILEQIQCNDPNIYRKKIKGFHIAFNIRDKLPTALEDASKKIQKQSTKLSQEDINKLASEIKNKKVISKKFKNREESEKFSQDRESLRKMHEQLRKERANEQIGSAIDEGANKNDKHVKVTFDVIEKLHYMDFNKGMKGEDFKPEDIVDLNDVESEEDEVLKKFKNDQPYESVEPVNSQNQGLGLKNMKSLRLKNGSVIESMRDKRPYKGQSISALGQFSQKKNSIDQLNDKILAIKGQMSKINQGNPQQQSQIIIQPQLIMNANRQVDPYGSNSIKQNYLSVNKSQMDTPEYGSIEQTQNNQLSVERQSKKRGGQVNQSQIQQMKNKLNNDYDNSLVIRPQLNNLSPLRQNISHGGLTQTNSRKIIKPLNQSIAIANSNQSLIYGIDDGHQLTGRHRDSSLIAQSLDTQQLLLSKQRNQSLLSNREKQGPILQAKNQKLATKLAEIGNQSNENGSKLGQYNSIGNLKQFQSNAPLKNSIIAAPGQLSQNQYFNDQTFGGQNSSRDQMLNRAIQIQQKSKIDQERQMNGIMKLHENNLKKGLNIVRKGKNLYKMATSMQSAGQSLQIYQPTETQLILKKDKICEFKSHIDDMKTTINKHFDHILDFIEEFVAIINDRLSTQRVIIEKCIALFEKKQPLLNEQNLYRVADFMENMIKELDKQCDRVRETNKPGSGKQVDPILRLKMENLIQRQIETIRQDQQYMDNQNKMNNVFRKKIKVPTIFSQVFEKRYIQESEIVHLKLQKSALQVQILLRKINQSKMTNNKIQWITKPVKSKHNQIKSIQDLIKENNALQNLFGRIIWINFDSQIKLLMRMDNPFKAKYFVVCSVQEYAFIKFINFLEKKQCLRRYLASEFFYYILSQSMLYFLERYVKQLKETVI